MKDLYYRCTRCKVIHIFAVDDAAKVEALREYPNHSYRRPIPFVCPECSTPKPAREARKLLQK
jgi:hypothetical protein